MDEPVGRVSGAPDRIPDAAPPLTCQRHRFTIPRELHWLNCAYMAPASRSVAEAGRAAIDRMARPGSIEAVDFFEPVTRVRELFAALVSAPDPTRIAIIPAVSYGVSICVRHLRPAAGQNLVLVHEQFPGNAYGWLTAARDSGAEVRMVEPPGSAASGGSAEWTEAILEAIDGDTAAVTLGPVHWTDGTLFDLEAIGARAREVGAALVIDGTQAVGAVPFDVGRVQPDALLCAGYKWLLGPYSIGAAYLGPRFDDARPLEETWIGRAGSEDFSGLVRYVDEYQPGAARFDVGERSNFVLTPMLTAALEQLLEWRPARIQAYCRELVGDLVRLARELGYQVAPESERTSHLFGIRVPPGVDLPALRAGLQERGVHVSQRGSALRVAPNVYNDEEDVAALAEALESFAP